MQAAFTLDDLPLWPHSAYPAGYSAEGIAEALIDALDRNGIRGVYAFSNSWALLERPELAGVLDRWVSAGHHVANHTHSHPTLNDVGADRYIEEIDLADKHLEPWLCKAPGRYFRYTLNLWGNTEEKRRRVKAHLEARDYTITEVTTWFYEWRWNAAFETCLAKGDRAGIEFLKRSFLDYAVAQLRYDMATASEWFGRDIKGVTLGHNVPFFADVASDLFARLIDAGLEFIPLEEAAADPVYAGAASVVADKFLNYQQKLAFVAGKPLQKIVPEFQATYARVGEIARA